MAAGTAETLVPDGDGEQSGIETAQLYANTHSAEGELRTVEDVDPTYVDDGIMQLQSYLGVSSASIYAHVRTLRETKTSVFDQERTPAVRAKSLPVGRTATRIVYTRANNSESNQSTDTTEPPETYLG